MNHIKKIINTISINNNNPSLLSVISYKPDKLITYNKPSDLIIYKHQHIPRPFNKIIKISIMKSNKIL